MNTFLFDRSETHSMSDIVGVSLLFVKSDDPKLEGWYWSYYGESSFTKVDGLILVKHGNYASVKAKDVADYLVNCYDWFLIGETT